VLREEDCVGGSDFVRVSDGEKEGDKDSVRTEPSTYQFVFEINPKQSHFFLN
jgi:hypothetical protein